MDDATLEAMYGGMLEATLESLVRQTALGTGWLYYHTHDSRRSDPGFPDCFMIRLRGGVVEVKVRELKKQKGKVTSEQQTWMDAFRAAGVDVGVWRPYDWGRGDIIKELE